MFAGILERNSGAKCIDPDLPTKVWEKISADVAVKPAGHMLTQNVDEDQLVVSDASLPPCPPDCFRVVCVSDTHNAHDSITVPRCDILVHAGDFTDVGLPRDIDAFCSWLSAQSQAKHKVVIAGNHDLSLDAATYPSNWQRFGHPEGISCAEQVEKMKKVCLYLEHEPLTLKLDPSNDNLHTSSPPTIVRIFGSPYQPEFGGWGFNLSRGDQCRATWASIPPPEPLPDQLQMKSAGKNEVHESFELGNLGYDILITHGPVLGHGDLCLPGRQRAGCADLLDYCEGPAAPLLHVCGHIHEGYGVTTNGKTLFMNASTMNLMYDKKRPQQPMVVDVPRDPGARAQWRKKFMA